MMVNEKVCPHCGWRSHAAALQCLHCGQYLPQPHSPYGPYAYGNPLPGHADCPPDAIISYPGTHSPVAPILLAIFINWWAGAMGNRQYNKGWALIGGNVLIAVAAMSVGALVGGIAAALVGLLVVAYLVFPLMHLVGIVDTVIIANRLNRGEPVSQWRFF